MIELFLWIVLAHVTADFILQTREVAGAKRAGERRGYLRHAAGHALALAVFTHRYLSPGMLFLWVVLPAAHVLLDWVKNRLVPEQHPADAPAFLLDQALHLAVIFVAWQWAAPPLCAPVAAFYGHLLAPSGEELWRTVFGGGELWTVLFAAVVYGYVVLGGSVLVRKVLDREALRLPGPTGRFADTGKAGRYIGFLERALILTLTLSGAYTSIAFVFTAKSIARYKELENRDFAEYYLVGTLLSTLLAVAGGLFLNSVLQVTPG